MDWDKIGRALKSLLSKFNLDLSHVGKAQRLEYTDFEQIFYHLFLMIDPSEVRRKFWSIFPARNKEEQSKFIDNAVLFINDRQLNGQRMSASQLRMCGGEPFRRLLGLLIERAAELEISAIEKKLGHTVMDGANLPEILAYRDKIQAKVQMQRDQIEVKLDEFNGLQETLGKLKQEKADMWSKLNPDVHEPDPSLRRIKVIYQSLLDRLEVSESRYKAAVQRLKELPMSMEISSSASSLKQNTPRRVSRDMVKEMREYLTLTPEFSPNLDKSNIAARMTQKLMDYDDGMEKLVSDWRDEQEKADEALLENEEMQERYKYFEKLVPLIDLKPLCLFRERN